MGWRGGVGVSEIMTFKYVYSVSVRFGKRGWVWSGYTEESEAKKKAEEIGSTGFWIRGKNTGTFIQPAAITRIFVRRQKVRA